MHMVGGCEKNWSESKDRSGCRGGFEAGSLGSSSVGFHHINPALITLVIYGIILLWFECTLYKRGSFKSSSFSCLYLFQPFPSPTMTLNISAKHQQICLQYKSRRVERQ
jgi:hypothetical protein